MTDDKDPNSPNLESFLQNDGDLPIETGGTSESLDTAGNFQINAPTQVSQPSGEKGSESPINPIGNAVAPKPVSPTQPNINQAEANAGTQSEKTTIDQSTVTTEGRPEIVSPEQVPQNPTNININLDKKEEASNLGQVVTSPNKPVEFGPINESPKQPTPIVENKTTESSVTQQNINLATNNSTDASTNSTTNQSVSNSVTNQTTGSSTTTVNSSLEELKSDSPKFLKRAAKAVGNVLSPIGERFAETGKESLKVVGSQLEKMGVPINLIKGAASEIRERRNEKKGESPISTINTTPNVSNQTSNAKSIENITNANTSLTQTSPTIQTETMVEKSNLVVEGKPTTATVQPTKVENPVVNQPQPIAPTITEVKQPKPETIAQNSTENNSPSPTVLMDTASLEARLKRIEMALTNPLEVIIKES